MRQRLVRRVIAGKVHWFDVLEAPAVTRSNGPSVITDTIYPTWHPATGKYYESKSRFRAETRARGLTETGNDTQRVQRATPYGHRDDVRRAVEKGAKIYITAKTILTPSARDLGEEKDVFAKA